MSANPFADALAKQQEFFVRGTACFRPQDAGYAPQPGLFTVAGQIAHAAMTVDWFIAGAFSPAGFDMDFPAHERAARAVIALDDAFARFKTGYDAAVARFAAASMAELQAPIAAGPIMGGAPRLAIVGALGDHTAHHRGCLAVYARMLGLAPPMPYA
jgi:uncharacterized damage-inducible protein DinB